MDLIKFAYGSDVNLYKDVLRVSASATDEEIQSAFVSRRYELFNFLQSASSDGTPQRAFLDSDGSTVFMSERQFTERKMDALIASYRLLADHEKRRQYNISLSLKAVTVNKIKHSESPVGVDDFRKSQSPLGGMDSSANCEGDDSWDLATPSNPNSGPVRTLPSETPLKTKKLFHSPDDAKTLNKNMSSSNNRRAAVLESNIIQHDSYLDCRSSNSDRGEYEYSENSFDDENTESSDDTYEYEKARRQRGKEIKKYSSSARTPESNRVTPNRKVTWSKDAEEEKKKKRTPSRSTAAEEANDFEYEPGPISNWLRSNSMGDEADFVDEIGQEIAGAASDTMLAISQIFSAFVIDDEAIDSMAGDIDDATKNLTSTGRGMSGKARRRKR